MSKKILVTGGAGYIGSFIVRQLKKDGFTPVIADNFSAGHRQAIEGFDYEEIDLVTQTDKLEILFKKQKFAGVIHMAGFIQMGESFVDPYKYYHNNLISVLNVLKAMTTYRVKKIIFSSSAGVYGSPAKMPIDEDTPKEPENPYGETKWATERMLGWFDKAHGIKSISIRYFNAAGAALDGSIGEDHPKESHIIPLVIKAAIEKKEFTLFGDDYKTKDGTCVRDYIHVLDIARAHVLALEKLFDGGETNYYNAGTGTGYSNKEIVEEVEKVAGKFKWKMGPRRAGDPDELVAANGKIKKELGWEPEFGLKEIINSAYKWHETHPKGYKN